MLRNEEKSTIQKLDELSLYLEIKKIETLLASLKHETLANITNEETIIKKELELKEKLNNLLISTLRFGIDPTNNENLKEWMSACNNYIQNLDMLEHTTFFCKKEEGDNLGLFGNSEYGESTILKNR